VCDRVIEMPSLEIFYHDFVLDDYRVDDAPS
jgi:hypothetical protein